MNSPSEKTITLIEKYIAGSLDDTEKEQLAHALSESPEARQLYLEYMDLNAALYWTSQSQDGAIVAKNQDSHSETIGDVSIDRAPSIPSPLAAPLPESSPDPLTTQANSSSSTFTSMIGFFAVGVALTIGVYQAVVVAPDTKPKEITEPAASQIAEVHSDQLKSDVIQLNSGSMNLILSKVGSVVIHGPAELRLLGPYRARLIHGQIKVNVSEEDAKGKFVVETPDGIVTDLGTEFVLNVSPGSKSSVSVLTGKLNLQVAQDSLSIDETPTELLNQGDGVTFRKGFETERLMSIVSDDDKSPDPLASNARRSTIKEVSDNLQKSDTKKFYQIVPQGMKKKASAYIDRSKYLWIGSKKDEKIPAYLQGGDYVRTFNQDKINSDLLVKITLNEPCDLYVLFDTNLQLPDWLLRDFTRCEEVIATSLSDETVKKRRNNRVTQSGSRVYDLYTIWKRTIPSSGTVELGSNFSKGAINFKSNDMEDASMYGIVAVPLKKADPPKDKGGDRPLQNTVKQIDAK